MSGGNFVTVVLLGRFAGVEQLGIFALLFSVVVLLTTGQSAMVATPYTVLRRHRDAEHDARFAGSVLVQSVAIGAMGLLLALLAALLLGLTGNANWAAVAALALVLPAGLFRDALRRLLFAWLRFGSVLFVDVLAVTFRIVALVVLTYCGRLDAASAILAWGAAEVVAAFGKLVFVRGRWSLRLNDLRTDFAECFAFGRWSLLAQGLYTAQVYGAQWMLAAMKGPVWVGWYAACAQLAQLIMPLITGVGNALVPVMSHRLRSGGREALVPVLRLSTVGLVTGTAAYALALALAAGWLLALLFGDSFAEHSTVAGWLALAVTLTAGGVAAAKGITTLERPGFNATINAITLPASLCFIGLGTAAMGLAGAAGGVVLGAALTLALRWCFFAVAWRDSASAEAFFVAPVGMEGTPTR
ncbi:MAG: oligosaccharide flippase family protein [Planctomycetota bacterium]